VFVSARAARDSVRNCELTAAVHGCILDGMKRIVLVLIATACAAAAVALVRPAAASAGWCWPNCSSYGFIGQWTSNYNGCWYSSGEVCSGWNSWFNIGVNKTCYPGCDWNYNTTSMVLFGFENRERIRGRFTVKATTLYVRPYELGMSGVLKAHVTWWSGPASQLNAGAIG
jgi:hypothetical protein